MSQPIEAVVFDFGGPVLLTPFELRAIGERSAGLAPGSLTWSGPFDPQADPDWRAFQAGEMTERDYWALQVDRFGELIGHDATMPELMAHLYAGPESELVRPEALALIVDVREAGLPIGLLTNDLTTFHDAAWVERMSILTCFDEMVDGRRDGVMKPDPAAYLLMCERLGVDPHATVFIDDQPVNLEGAAEVGMICVLLDPTDPHAGFAAARRRIGLAS